MLSFHRKSALISGLFLCVIREGPGKFNVKSSNYGVGKFVKKKKKKERKKSHEQKSIIEKN